MKIAFLDAQPHWSGGAKRVYLLAEGLSKKGHDVHIICLKNSELSKIAKNSGLKVYLYNPYFIKSIISFIHMIFYFKKNRIEIIDINSPRFYWTGLLAGKITNTKIILTRNVPYRKKFIKRIINRILYSNVNAVIAVSQFVKNIIQNDFSKKIKVEVIYDGIKLENSLNTIKQKTTETLNMAIIGRIEKNKGHEVALKAMSILKKVNKNIHLVIAGAGKKRILLKLKLLAKNLKVDGIVSFIGFKEDIYKTLSCIDIVIVPSFEEALGLNILEAMSFGKVVIASNTGGIPEVIKDGYNGILFTPGDHIELADSIIRLFSKDIRESMSKNALKIIENNFLIEKKVSEYENLIKNLK